MGIPLAAIIIYQNIYFKDLKQQISYYQKQEDESRYLTVWALKEDILAGDEITRGNMIKTQVRMPNTEDINVSAELAQFTGKSAKTALKKGTILQEDLLYEGSACQDDMRKKEVTFVDLPKGLAKDEYIDIRIGFPDGEDYIVIRHKKVLELLADGEEAKITGLSIELSEEEQLRLSAARIDANTYQNTSIYAIQYRKDFQKEAIAYYPVNGKVYELLNWDPNIIERVQFGKEQRKRKTLEENMQQYKLEEVSETIPEIKETEEYTGLSDITVPDESELEIFE